jgi:CRP-like cAMP-binding protein
MLHDGRRQIITIMLPGELTEKGPEMPFGSPDAVVALSSVVAHPIHRSALLDLTQQAPTLLYALFYEELTRHAITREWILLHSKRDAVERLAYFFYETFARLRAMGLIEGERFELPLNQEDVADLLGVSHVHLNRTLQALRRQNHLIWEGHSVTIADEAGLARAAAFNPELIKIAEEFAARAKASQAADS